MNEIRIGLVGAGSIAENLHLPAYEKAKCKGITLAAICDIDIEKAKRAAEKYGVPHYYASVDEMLEKEDIDGVDICTWNAAHVPVCLAAARAGKHIMCEKPAAMTVAELVELKKIVDEKGLVYILAVPGRFAEEAIALKKRVDAGDMGNIYYGKTSYMRQRGEPIGWFTDKKLSGGGPVLDIGVHAIDGAWYLMGQPRPVRVSAMTYSNACETKLTGFWTGAPSDGTHDTEDSGAGVIYFENGAQLFFEASWTINAPDFRDTVILGSKSGAVRVNPPKIYSEHEGYLTEETMTIPSSDTGYGEVTHFAECIRNGERNTRYDINKAIEMQSMLDAIYKSAEFGREVIIDEKGDIK